MIVKKLIQLLEKNKEAFLHIMLPSGIFVPNHFHITEVGKLQKIFVDCGGICHESVSCLLQVWTAHDVEHRLKAGKLSKILQFAEKILNQEMNVEVEYGIDVAAQYFLADVEVTPKGLLLMLSGKKTDCLAPDKCGISGC